MSVDLNSPRADGLTPSPATHAPLVFIRASLLACVCAMFIPHPPSPALSHTSIIVFYLCLTIACRNIAHAVIDETAVVSAFLPFFCFFSLLDPVATSSRTHCLVASPTKDSGSSALFLANLLTYLYFALLVIRFFFLL